MTTTLLTWLTRAEAGSVRVVRALFAWPVGALRRRVVRDLTRGM